MTRLILVCLFIGVVAVLVRGQTPGAPCTTDCDCNGGSTSVEQCQHCVAGVCQTSANCPGGRCELNTCPITSPTLCSSDASCSQATGCTKCVGIGTPGPSLGYCRRINSCIGGCASTSTCECNVVPSPPAPIPIPPAPFQPCATNCDCNPGNSSICRTCTNNTCVTIGLCPPSAPVCLPTGGGNVTCLTVPNPASAIACSTNADCNPMLIDFCGFCNAGYCTFDPDPLTCNTPGYSCSADTCSCQPPCNNSCQCDQVLTKCQECTGSTCTTVTDCGLDLCIAPGICSSGGVACTSDSDCSTTFGCHRCVGIGVVSPSTGFCRLTQSCPYGCNSTADCECNGPPIIPPEAPPIECTTQCDCNPNNRSICSVCQNGTCAVVHTCNPAGSTPNCLYTGFFLPNQTSFTTCVSNGSIASLSCATDADCNPRSTAGNLTACGYCNHGFCEITVNDCNIGSGYACSADVCSCAALPPPVAPPVPPPVAPPVPPPVAPPVAPPVTPPTAPPVAPPVKPPVTPPYYPPLGTIPDPPLAPSIGVLGPAIPAEPTPPPSPQAAPINDPAPVYVPLLAVVVVSFFAIGILAVQRIRRRKRAERAAESLLAESGAQSRVAETPRRSTRSKSTMSSSNNGGKVD